MAVTSWLVDRIGNRQPELTALPPNPSRGLSLDDLPNLQQNYTHITSQLAFREQEAARDKSDVATHEADLKTKKAALKVLNEQKQQPRLFGYATKAIVQLEAKIEKVEEKLKRAKDSLERNERGIAGWKRLISEFDHKTYAELLEMQRIDSI